jgi:hypothetical protein
VGKADTTTPRRASGPGDSFPSLSFLGQLTPTPLIYKTGSECNREASDIDAWNLGFSSLALTCAAYIYTIDISLPNPCLSLQWLRIRSRRHLHGIKLCQRVFIDLANARDRDSLPR